MLTQFSDFSFSKKPSPSQSQFTTTSPNQKKMKMKSSLRSFLDAFLSLYTPKNSSHQVDFLAAYPLDARSDRVMPGFFPAARSTSPAPPPAPPPATPPAPPPVTVTITSISTSTSLITTTINVTVNSTYYVTNTETFTTAIPTTSLTTTITNNTVTIPPATPEPTHASDVSAVADVKNPVSASEVLAIVSGLTNLALLLAMFFLVRRFYRMYRQERVLRKQVQTEGVELAEAGGAQDVQRKWSGG